MANRRLNKAELDIANNILNEIREKIKVLTRNDDQFLFALRRKIYKELTYDERGKPMMRRKLKKAKWAEQDGICPVCERQLPETFTILDRLNAADGYTAENTRLIHSECDRKVQENRKFNDV